MNEDIKINIEIPRQLNQESGWTVSYKWLEKFHKHITALSLEDVSFEEIETVILGLSTFESE